MEKKSKKSVVIGITILFLVTLILLGLTYAYYRTRIVGNNEEKSISVTSKKLEVTYSDDKAVIEASNIEPGYTATKTFTVENTGSEPTNFGIVLDNVENTFTRKSDWTFVLKQGNIVIKEGIVPSQTSYILNTKSIAADETIEYTLTINYANLTDVNQSEDMGKSLIIRVNIANETGAILESAEDGTLLAAIRDNNLISETLTVPGKMPSSLSYIPDENFGNETAVTVSEENQERYITYGSELTHDPKSGGYRITDIKYGKYKDVYNELSGKYLWQPRIMMTSEPSEAFLSVGPAGSNTTVYKISEDVAPTLTSYTYLSKTQTPIVINEAELSATEDDYGTSYYYRGTVENNYVNFSGMCWNIVRVQGNGTIKLILADDERLCNDAGFGDTYEGGYLDGGQTFRYTASSKSGLTAFDYTESDVKKVLDAWLNDTSVTLEDGYTKTFSNSIDTTNLVGTNWCNDTTQTLVTDSITYFGGYHRIGDTQRNLSPSLRCDFTGINNTEPTILNNSMIGILNADEAAFSGVAGDQVNFSGSIFDLGMWTNYLTINGYEFWTMTPNNYWTTGNNIYSNFVVYINEIMGQDILTAKYPIRPVVILKADAKISGGNGTQIDPYVIG